MLHNPLTNQASTNMLSRFICLRIAVLFSTLLNVFFIFSQENNISVHEKIIGKNLLDQSNIYAQEYLFPGKIINTFFNTDKQTLILQTKDVKLNGQIKNKGKIICYSLHENKVIWQNRLNYIYSSVYSSKNNILLTKGSYTICINNTDGTLIWKSKHRLFQVIDEINLGLGYIVNKKGIITNALEAIELDNGNVKWQREVSRNVDWNNIFYLNDSTIGIITSGLYVINLNNGKGWDYISPSYKKTGSNNTNEHPYGKFGMFLTNYCNPYMYADYNILRYDIVSNPIIDSTSIVFASKDSIVRIDISSGKKIWSKPLPQLKTSQSELFVSDSIIYMINLGSVNNYHHGIEYPIPYGTKFIAAFNKETGEQQYLVFNKSTDDPVQSYSLYNDEIILFNKQSISKYSIKNGSLIAEKELDSDINGVIRFCFNDNAYIMQSENNFTCLSSSDTSRWIYTSTNEALLINHKLDLINRLPTDSLYYYYMNYNGYKFITLDGLTIILDYFNKPLFELNISKETIFIGQKLYAIYDQSFLEIDLSILLENPNLKSSILAENSLPIIN